MNPRTVVMTVPASAEHLSLLRTVVHYYAGREQFTLDQIDDLKMAVDESGVQLLRRGHGPTLVLEMTPADAAMELRVGIGVREPVQVIDEDSFSWQILSALADTLRVEESDGRVTVVLEKHRHPSLSAEGGA